MYNNFIELVTVTISIVTVISKQGQKWVLMVAVSWDEYVSQLWVRKALTSLKKGEKEILWVPAVQV